MNKKVISLVSAIILVLLVIGLAVFSIAGRDKTSRLDILAAPSGASLSLDGQDIKSGIKKVKPGSHIIVASKTGFESQTKTIAVVKNGSQFIGIILQPNTAETANWYKDHPEDYGLVQSINNRLFDQTSSQALASNPLLKKLPHIGPNLSFRVDYGVPSDKSKTGQPGIYIRYRTEKDKQAALQWIKDQGSDPSSLDVIYIQGNF